MTTVPGVHPDFHRYMLVLAVVYAVELAWVAIPGGASFNGSPAEGIALLAALLVMVWRRWRPVYIVTVVLQGLGLISVTLFAGLNSGGVIAIWLIFMLLQLCLLLSAPVRRTVMRSYETHRPAASQAAAGVRS